MDQINSRAKVLSSYERRPIKDQIERNPTQTYLVRQYFLKKCITLFASQSWLLILSDPCKIRKKEFENSACIHPALPWIDGYKYNIVSHEHINMQSMNDTHLSFIDIATSSCPCRITIQFHSLALLYYTCLSTMYY